VEVDETRQARIGSSVTGRISELLVFEGDRVRKGQVLARLHSTELTTAQSSFLKAYSQEQLSRRASERADMLLNAGVIGSAEVQRRQTELQQAMADSAAARDQLLVLGVPRDGVDRLQASQKITSLSQVVASLNGIVLERKATLGQVVQPADNIFILADLSTVWIVADVPEQEAGNIVEDEEAEVEISALPGRIIHGRITHVHPTLNPETRTVRVHMDVQNPGQILKPAMLARMKLKGAKEERLLVPVSAIVREDNREYVFVKAGERKYILREVSLGAEYDNTRVIQAGVTKQDTIVLDGAFHLNNERKHRLSQGATN
jgi:cobalt-zinc-cadmium efflux system membrane fusion protein